MASSKPGLDQVSILCTDTLTYGRLLEKVPSITHTTYYTDTEGKYTTDSASTCTPYHLGKSRGDVSDVSGAVVLTCIEHLLLCACLSCGILGREGKVFLLIVAVCVIVVGLWRPVSLRLCLVE